MDAVFLKVLNMSISASWLVLVVMVLRFLLKKSPRWVHVALWALVAVRLICPVSIESVLSLIPSSETLPQEIIYSQKPAIDSGVEVIDRVVNTSMSESLTPQPGASVNPIQVHLFVQENIWCLGMVLMAAWAWVSYLRLRKKVYASLNLGNGVYLCDYIDTPFILGILDPKIYLPSDMDSAAAAHVLAHERAHLARRDHWWKPFGYLLLTVHWFNPVLWLGYILLCRDIELACDEKVIRDMELPQKKAYSEALLNCSVNRRHIAACPLAFGEVGVKERVKTVLHYKKPAFWIALIAVVALIVTAICFLTDPVKEEEISYRVEQVVYRNPLLSYYMTEENAPMFQIAGDSTLRIKENDEDWVELGEFSEIQLSDLNFDTLFFSMEIGVPRDDNQEAWILAVPPAEERNSSEFYLLWKQSGGIYLGEGIAFTNVYPIHENILDATLSVNWLYKLVEADSPQAGEQLSPYEWTGTVKVADIRKAWAYPYGQATYSVTIEGSGLEALIGLLNDVPENEIVLKKPSGIEDPLWNYDGTSVHLPCTDGTSIYLRYVDDTVIIKIMTNPEQVDTEGYWVVENEALKNWLQNLAHGGTYMLSDANRDEIRQLVKQENVQFFSPREYDGYLFVGCAYDNGRGLGVACFEKVAYGYKLVRLIRDGDVKQCASGSELYYCDHNNRRIFLVMNDSVSGIEFAGAYEARYAIDTHPGLLVEYYPPFLVSMYRFVYGDGNATTMYMDWDNETHAQVPGYDVANLDDPDDAYRVCSNLKLSQVDFIWATEILEVDDRYSQAYTYELTDAQIEEVMNLLCNLPENAYEQTEVPQTNVRCVDLFLTNDAGLLMGYPVLRLKIDQGAVYYQLLLDAENTSQGWKINDPRLVKYLESFYDADISAWHLFAPIVKTDGEVIWSDDGVEVTIPKVSCFHYEVFEEGIRFKPEGQEGWVLLQYRTEPYTPEELGLRRFNGVLGGREVVSGCYGDLPEWDFLEITVTSGDAAINILMLNEDSAAWVAEYDPEIIAIIQELNILDKD